MNIKEQVEWERECARRGEEHYYATQDNLREKGRHDQCEGYTFIMRDRLQDIADAIEAAASSPVAGFHGTFGGIVRKVSGHVPYVMMAFFATQAVLRAVSNGKNRKSLNATKVIASIGERIETEIKCRMFEQKNPEYYDTIIKSFKEQKLHSYTHKRNVIMTKFNTYNIGWDDWGPKGRIGVGARILEAFLKVMDDLFFIDKVWESRKCVTKIVPTVAFDEWLAAFEQTRGLMQPLLLPLKVKPMDWNEDGQGGYYTPRMQLALPFIKVKGKEHAAFVKRFIPHQHIAAVNKMQSTKWRINKQVLEVMETAYHKDLGFGLPQKSKIVPPPIPDFLNEVAKEDYCDAMKEELMFWKAQAKQAYYEEAKRKGKVLTFMQTLKLAQELRDWDEFYFAYSCDFRGRIYSATACLSTQGDERARALLYFKEEVPLGEQGVWWLAIHGASTFGVKGTHLERYQWTIERANQIHAIVTDPYSNKEWTKADKPYQFLAFCFEWAKVKYGTDISATSGLPVGIDGSCNGLQHFSAILRDPVGAKATNLVYSERPNDIYGTVALRTMGYLGKADDGIADTLVRIGVERDGTKRQTMTLPYGATKQACREYTFEWVVGKWEQFDMDKKLRWTVASYLSPIIWQSIEDTVVAAVTAMNWLQRNVSKRYVKWVSHVNFPVYQYYKDMKPVRINTKLAGKTRLSARDINADGEPNIYKQKLGIVPNFIHSVDASHLVMTVNGTDLPGYAMVHDEYGTHAGNMHILFGVTIQAFHELHQVNQLERWAKHQGIPLESVPKQGSFDIDEVLKANYLFGS